MSGKLYLLPTALADTAVIATTTPRTREIIARLEIFIVEEPKTARRFLSHFDLAKPLASLQWLVLNEHTPPDALAELLAPLRACHDVGLLSEAGCPAIADPGASLTRIAHANNITVVPLAGPSSILLALMASGLNGQRFRFHGYLPVRGDERRAALRALELEARQRRETQIFIETPYRNLALFSDILASCAAATLLCIASDLTSATERVELRAIAEWKRHPPDIQRRPSVFLLAADQA